MIFLIIFFSYLLGVLALVVVIGGGERITSHELIRNELSAMKQQTKMENHSTFHRLSRIVCYVLCVVFCVVIINRNRLDGLKSAENAQHLFSI